MGKAKWHRIYTSDITEEAEKHCMRENAKQLAETGQLFTIDTLGTHAASTVSQQARKLLRTEGLRQTPKTPISKNKHKFRIVRHAQTKMEEVFDLWGDSTATRSYNASAKRKLQPPKLARNVPKVVLPHPGQSYHPSYTDITDALVSEISKEVKLAKKEYRQRLDSQPLSSELAKYLPLGYVSRLSEVQKHKIFGTIRVQCYRPGPLENLTVKCSSCGGAVSMLESQCAVENSKDDARAESDKITVDVTDKVDWCELCKGSPICRSCQTCSDLCWENNKSQEDEKDSKPITKKSRAKTRAERNREMRRRVLAKELRARRVRKSLHNQIKDVDNIVRSIQEEEQEVARRKELREQNRTLDENMQRHGIVKPFRLGKCIFEEPAMELPSYKNDGNSLRRLKVLSSCVKDRLVSAHRRGLVPGRTGKSARGPTKAIRKFVKSMK